MEIVRVSEVDYAKGLIKVELPAKDNMSFPTGSPSQVMSTRCRRSVTWSRVEFEPDKYGNPYTSGICYKNV